MANSNMPAQPTVSRLCSEYLKVNKRIEESTAYLTRQAFSHLLDFLGDVEIGEVSRLDAQKFQADLVDRGCKKTSANIFVKSIKPVFNWAVDVGYLDESPFAGLRNFKVMPGRVRVFELGEINRLLIVSDILWKARILLGLTTLRKGEVLNLTVDDVDFQKNLISIQSKAESTLTWRFEPKDHELRVLPMISMLRELLLELRNSNPPGQPYFLLKPPRYEYLLRHRYVMNDRLRKCPDNNFTRAFRSLCNRAFVKGTFKMLRATGLTQLTDRQNNLRMQEVQEIAGHSSIETTRRYLAAGSDYLTRANDALSRGVAQFG